MHVDTGHNFQEVLDFRDRRVAELGVQLVVASVQEAIDNGSVVEPPDGTRNRIQTPVLLDALEKHRFTAIFGGARRDEDKARAKERIFSFRDDFGQWDPKNQRPELWNLYNGRIHPGESIRVFPLSNWTELDIWQYIEQEGIELPSIYFAHEREVFERNGMLFGVHEYCRPQDGEEVTVQRVRYRTVGDASLTAAVRVGRRHRGEGDRRGGHHPDHRARGHPRRRQVQRGRHGRPQARGLLLRWTSSGSRRRGPSTTARAR